MVSPVLRRQAVDHLQTAFDVSECGACRVVRQPRSIHRYHCSKPLQDAPFAKGIQTIAARETLAGYRTVTKQLRRDGWEVNTQARATDLETRKAQNPCQTGKETRWG